MSDLNARLLEAHAARDKHALVGLYAEAAHSTGADEEKWFFLTQAYIFALEQDHHDLADLRAQLVTAGRETP